MEGQRKGGYVKADDGSRYSVERNGDELHRRGGVAPKKVSTTTTRSGRNLTMQKSK